jgi:hypothetical protein
MTVGDRTYKQFRAFVDDYAATKAGKYAQSADLPKPREEASTVTEIWFKLTDVPAELDQKVLQVDLYRWDEEAKGWSKFRWANGDRQVFGKGRTWQQHLSVTAPRDSRRAGEIVKAKSATLPRGKYLAKVYVDREDRLAKDFTYILGKEEFVGQIEVNSDWPAGYGSMTTARYPNQ